MEIIMSEDYIEDYLKAGKAAIAAKKLARKIATPGALFLEIANKSSRERIIKN